MNCSSLDNLYPQLPSGFAVNILPHLLCNKF